MYLIKKAHQSFFTTESDYLCLEVGSALDAGDTSKAGLQCYKTMLDDSFVMRDMKQYQNFPEFLEECPRMFNEYPEMIRDIMNPMFIVDGKPRQSMKKMAMGPVKKVGIMKIAKDAMKGIKAL